MLEKRVLLERIGRPIHQDRLVKLNNILQFFTHNFCGNTHRNKWVPKFLRTTEAVNWWM